MTINRNLAYVNTDKTECLMLTAGSLAQYLTYQHQLHHEDHNHDQLRFEMKEENPNHVMVIAQSNIDTDNIIANTDSTLDIIDSHPTLKADHKLINYLDIIGLTKHENNNNSYWPLDQPLDLTNIIDFVKNVQQVTIMKKVIITFAEIFDTLIACISGIAAIGWCYTELPKVADWNQTVTNYYHTGFCITMIVLTLATLL